jgi:hypothetical protein
VHEALPEAIDLERTASMSAHEKLSAAFSAAETQLGVPQLLDAATLLKTTDEKSVMLYAQPQPQPQPEPEPEPHPQP